MALDPACVRRVEAWLRGARGGTAWLTGAQGSGMTTMVRALVADMEAVWLTPATMPSRAFVRNACSNPVAVNGKRKVLVLDEFDAVLGSEPATQELVFVMKHSAHVPVMCILKATRATLTADLRAKAALVVDFPVPTHEAMVALVTRIARAEGLCVGEERISELCARVPGDVRHVVQTLRAAVDTTRDVFMQTAHAVACVFEGAPTIEHAMHVWSGDSGGIPSGVFETYCRVTDRIEQCTAYLDMASLADVVDRRIHAKQRWELLDLHGALSVGGAAVTLPRKAGVRPTKYGTLWNKNYMQCSKAKTVKGINDRRAERGMMRLGAEELGYVRGMLAHTLPDVDEAARVCQRAGLGAQECLHVMRLWVSGYKLGTHAKLKRALASSTTRA